MCMLLMMYQVTISSGGMLTEKLDPHDLNLEARRHKFDGTFAYGQHKVIIGDIKVHGFICCLLFRDNKL